MLFLVLGHLKITEVDSHTKKGLRKGDTVYHVANPDVPGRVVTEPKGAHIGVNFSVPVGFSGNPARGLARYWKVSINLLHPTSAEAWAHKRF